MPTSLVIGALVIAWLVVLVPMVARRRQEVAKTADSVLAARVVRSGATRSTREERGMPEAREKAGTSEAFEVGRDTAADMTIELPLPQEAFAQEGLDDYDDYQEDMEVVHADDLPLPARRYRPGRGGFDPEAAKIEKRAKYARRQRTVLAMLVAAVATALFAAIAWSTMWWLHGLIDLGLVGYLTYLRRQVRIEEDVLARRMMRARTVPRHETAPREAPEPEEPSTPEEPDTVTDRHPGTAVVDLDDGDPEFDELDGPGSLPYRKAAGE